jgi:hypothetical protein
MRSLRVITVTILAFMPALLEGQAKLKVLTEPQNVVASRLVGDWEPDPALTVRLLGSPPNPTGGIATTGDVGLGGRMSFRADTAIASRIPARMVTAITAMPTAAVYMSGVATLGGKEWPFLLLAAQGNQMILMFRERGGDPYGDSESFLLTITPAKDRANDLLFAGGDFNNQPFRAYRRVGGPATGRGGR